MCILHVSGKSLKPIFGAKPPEKMLPPTASSGVRPQHNQSFKRQWQPLPKESNERKWPLMSGCVASQWCLATATMGSPVEVISLSLRSFFLLRGAPSAGCGTQQQPNSISTLPTMALSRHSPFFWTKRTSEMAPTAKGEGQESGTETLWRQPPKKCRCRCEKISELSAMSYENI